MYPKKTLSAASLLSESEFSMGIAAACPFSCLNRVREQAKNAS